MIDFMIIGLPRSGTTWAANWLTYNKVVCHHDPLHTVHYLAWDRRLCEPVYNYFGSDSDIGVSCTGIWRWPDWVNKHPAKKVILIRDLDSVQRSLEKLGAGRLPKNADRMLDEIEGLRAPYTNLFQPYGAGKIFEHLMPGAIHCEERHRQLCQMKVEPQLNKVRRDLLLHRELSKELFES